MTMDFSHLHPEHLDVFSDEFHFEDDERGHADAETCAALKRSQLAQTVVKNTMIMIGIGIDPLTALLSLVVVAIRIGWYLRGRYETTTQPPRAVADVLGSIDEAELERIQQEIREDERP